MCRIKRNKNRKNYVLSTYGFEVKPRGVSLNRDTNGETELNIYSQQPADLRAPLTTSIDQQEEEPVVSIQVSTITEREDEPEIFTNEGAADPEKDTSLSDDIAKELAEETQVMNITFDEPGEETKL